MTRKDEITAGPGPVRVRADVPGVRKCLRCTATFPSSGFGERICRRCKGLNVWRSAPPISPGVGRKR
jgi:hypothetical protein